jgi:hypothetical protein
VTKNTTTAVEAKADTARIDLSDLPSPNHIEVLMNKLPREDKHTVLAEICATLGLCKQRKNPSEDDMTEGIYKCKSPTKISKLTCADGYLKWPSELIGTTTVHA